jgi:hypothetical protein
MPKFDPMVASVDTDEEVDHSGNHNKFGMAMGLDKERPIGNKAAKRQKVEEKSYVFMQSARNADFKSAMAGTDRLATVMENKAMHEMWFRMFIDRSPFSFQTNNAIAPVQSRYDCVFLLK